MEHVPITRQIYGYLSKELRPGMNKDRMKRKFLTIVKAQLKINLLP
jgi:hypothetical protein